MPDLPHDVFAGDASNTYATHSALNAAVSLLAFIGSELGFLALPPARAIAPSHAFVLGGAFGAASHALFIPTVQTVGFVAGAFLTALFAAAVAYLGTRLFSRRNA